MFDVRKTIVPDNGPVKTYEDRQDAKVDSYKIIVPGHVSLSDYIGSFYRGRLFRMERKIIHKVTGHASSDAQIEELLAGERDTFSAWTRDAESENQLIMCDYQSRTCSWFMVEPDGSNTVLRFGTVIKPTDYAGRFERFSKLMFTLFMPLHGLYSRLLLSQAAKPFRA